MALWCFVAMALSGVVNAFVRIQPRDLLHSGYGALVVAKMVALCALGVLGWRQRRSGVAALQADSQARGPLIRLALTEAAVFGLTFGVAVALGRTPPPAAAVVNPSIPEVEIGYDLAGPPTVATPAVRLALRPRVRHGGDRVRGAVPGRGAPAATTRGHLADGPTGGVAAGLRGAVVRDVVGHGPVHAGDVQHAHGRPHAVVDAGADPAGAGRAGHPRVAGAAGRRARRSARLREWLLAALHSRVSQILTNPFVATALFIVGFYGLYLGGIFDAAVGNHAAHVAMNLHFLLSGYLFYWVVIGVDPTPRPIPSLAKLGMVFASLPLHAFFGVVLMGMQTVLGGTFYKSLQLPWHTDLLGDQRLGGGIAWAAGEVPLVVVMIALLIQWTRSDRRTAKRLDRAADRDNDADLAAYNAMLAEIARRDGQSR